MIKLSYFTQDNFSQLIEWMPDAKFAFMWSGLSFVYPLTDAQLATYIKEANKPNALKYVFKAIDTATNQVVGHISITIDAKNNCARIGKVFIAPNTRGKGYGKNLMIAILTFIFEELKLHKASLGVFDFNRAAYQCYLSMGFVQEGLLRDGRKYGNDYYNLIEMGMLKSEWNSKKAFYM